MARRADSNLRPATRIPTGSCACAIAEPGAAGSEISECDFLDLDPDTMMSIVEIRLGGDVERADAMTKKAVVWLNARRARKDSMTDTKIPPTDPDDLDHRSRRGANAAARMPWASADLKTAIGVKSAMAVFGAYAFDDEDERAAAYRELIDAAEALDIDTNYFESVWRDATFAAPSQAEVSTDETSANAAGLKPYKGGAKIKLDGERAARRKLARRSEIAWATDPFVVDGDPAADMDEVSREAAGLAPFARVDVALDDEDAAADRMQDRAARAWLDEPDDEEPDAEDEDEGEDDADESAAHRRKKRRAVAVPDEDDEDDVDLADEDAAADALREGNSEAWHK
jgi:hypothetical protein